MSIEYTTDDDADEDDDDDDDDNATFLGVHTAAVCHLQFAWNVAIQLCFSFLTWLDRLLFALVELGEVLFER